MENQTEDTHNHQPNVETVFDDLEEIHPLNNQEHSQELDQSLDSHLARLETGNELNSSTNIQSLPRNARGGRNQSQDQSQPQPSRGGGGNRSEVPETKEQSTPFRSRGNRNPVPEQAHRNDSSAWDEGKDQEPNEQGTNKQGQQHQKDDKKPLDDSNQDDYEDKVAHKQPKESKSSGRSGWTTAPQIDTPKSDDEQSNWDQGNENERKEPAPRNGRNKPKKQDEENELEPDKAHKVNESNWQESKQKEKQPEPQTSRGRGNRGNRGNRDEEQPYENNGRRGGRVNRDFNGEGYPQRNFDKDGGFNREGGRGGFRGGRGGGFRGNREEGGFGRGNREQGGFGRGNRQEGGFGRGNREQGGFGRGNRQEGGFNRGNRYDQGNNRGPFARKQGGFGVNLSNNNSQNFRGSQNSSNNEAQNSQSSQQSINSNIKSAPVYDAVALIEPKGLQSWPQVSLYAKKCKVSLTLRSINQHQADALVFPVEDMNFKLYPSVLINADDKYNYRAKMKEKFDTDYWSKCCVYRKSAHGMGKFRDILFCKVSTEQEPNYNDTIMTLIKYALVEPQCESLVFPICKDLKNFKSLLSIMIQSLIILSEHKKCFLKRVEFSTKDTELFKECSGVFLTKISEDIDANKIYID